MQAPPPTNASPLHTYGELARDVLAIWGAISLVFIAINKVVGWRNRRKEKREHKLRQSVYHFLLNSKDSHSVGGIWAEVVIKPILEGVKLKYAVEYENWPGWKIQLGILYWNIRVWFRKIGMPTETDIAAILAEIHRDKEVTVNALGYYRVA
jgi:hypothetical protein